MSDKTVTHDVTFDSRGVSPKSIRVIRTRDGSIYQFAVWPDSPRATPEVRRSASGNLTRSPSDTSMPEGIKEMVGIKRDL